MGIFFWTTFFLQLQGSFSAEGLDDCFMFPLTWPSKSIAFAHDSVLELELLVIISVVVVVVMTSEEVELELEVLLSEELELELEPDGDELESVLPGCN